MRKLFIAVVVLILMSFSFASSAPAGSWEFNFTKLDTGVVTDLAGYRIYLVPTGQPIVTGNDNHFWQSPDNDPAMPIVLTNIPEGVWDSVWTAVDTGNQESDPTPICVVTVDDAPPTPPGYSCQPAP